MCWLFTASCARVRPNLPESAAVAVVVAVAAAYERYAFSEPGIWILFSPSYACVCNCFAALNHARRSVRTGCPRFGNSVRPVRLLGPIPPRQTASSLPASFFSLSLSLSSPILRFPCVNCTASLHFSPFVTCVSDGASESSSARWRPKKPVSLATLLPPPCTSARAQTSWTFRLFFSLCSADYANCNESMVRSDMGLSWCFTVVSVLRTLRSSDRYLFRHTKGGKTNATWKNIFQLEEKRVS